MAHSAVSLYLKFESGLIEGLSPYLVTRQQFKTPEECRLLIANISKSTTIYIGNLSFYTTEEQLHAHFSSAGMVKRVIMGMNRFSKESCGFAFVEYYGHQSALNAKQTLHKTRLGGRFLKVDIDEGFTQDRLFGRGELGQQIRDTHRTDYDADRGGYSSRMKKLEQQFSIGGADEQKDEKDEKDEKVEKDVTASSTDTQPGQPTYGVNTDHTDNTNPGNSSSMCE